MDKPKRIILAGGSGFLGSILSNHFAKAGWEIVVFSRKQSGPEAAHKGTKREVLWDGKTLGPWTEFLEDCDALVNLSGRTVNCRFTPENRKAILDSRVNSTRILGEAISRCKKPPAVWLNCSGAGIYNESFDKDMNETDRDFTDADTGKSFSGQVARLWERAFEEANAPATRKVTLRISMVLGARKGTPFRVFRRLAKAGLAGRMGTGKQYVSWIHETDFCRVVDWLIQAPGVRGAVNVTAPKPVTNEEFMRSVRRTSGWFFGLPAAWWMLEIGAFFMRTETELILNSRRVAPNRLVASGFAFQFPELRPALDDLEERCRANG